MQVYENILKEIYKILQTFVPQGLAIGEETDMVADLGLDSLKVMKIVESIEDSFDISIPLNILPKYAPLKILLYKYKN